MHVTIMDIFVFFSAYMLILGVWQFLYIKIHKKGYELEKKENETFFEFMCRYYEDDFFWKLRKKYGIKWLYNSKIFEKYIKLKGIILILFGLIVVFGLLLLRQTDYYVWLSIEI